ncbi:MAG: hypothetical protein H0U75_00460 [Legionella sp.]|nr:hypothetical protein [Legionella sp.]
MLKLSDAQLFRKLLRLSGDCLKMAVDASVSITATVSTPVESAVTTSEVKGIDDNDMFVNYNIWKAANPNRKVVRETSFMGSSGLSIIYISHTS